MAKEIILFDMDGVLLAPIGYQKALKSSVKRFGQALGVPEAHITTDQIARFEAAHITNEWDTLAICTALILVKAWEFDPSVRMDGVQPSEITLTKEAPNIDLFLDHLINGGTLPGKAAFNMICKLFPRLNTPQCDHLRLILDRCGDIYTSPTLPSHQETILGSNLFQEVYGISPQLDVGSYLLQCDRPIMTGEQHTGLLNWLSDPDHYAGIMTNRPSSTPPGYLSPPEAELGTRLIELEDLAFVGSGILCWYEANYTDLQAHALLKPNPVHALALLQRCLGRPTFDSLVAAVELWQGGNNHKLWHTLDGAKIAIFEDSTKGLLSGVKACDLLADSGVQVDLTLIGVSNNPIKLQALNEIATYTIENINQIDWGHLFC